MSDRVYGTMQGDLAEGSVTRTVWAETPLRTVRFSSAFYGRLAGFNGQAPSELRIRRPDGHGIAAYWVMGTHRGITGFHQDEQLPYSGRRGRGFRTPGVGFLFSSSARRHESSAVVRPSITAAFLDHHFAASYEVPLRKLLDRYARDQLFF